METMCAADGPRASLVSVEGYVEAFQQILMKEKYVAYI